jgi:hypothetical protein
LLVLCAPFVWVAGRSDAAAARLEARAHVRGGLDDGARLARHRLAQSHPSRDATPHHDSAEELSVRRGEAVFGDPGGTLIDVRARDLSGLVDLESASPQLIGNLMGASSYLLAPLSSSAEELRLANAAGFGDGGVLWIDGELVRFVGREGNVLHGLERGFLATEESCGPAGARDHPAGTPVLLQEAFALAMWRASRGFEGDPGEAAAAPFEAIADFALAGALAPERRARLEAHGSFLAGVGGGNRWQHPVRLVDDLRAGESCVLTVSEARWFNPGATLRLSQDGRSELAIVLRVTGSGRVVLLDAVGQDWQGGVAEVAVLARRPVQINSAPEAVLQALFENLALLGTNERVTASEAAELARRIAEGRPFEGMPDLMERVLLPAAGLQVVAEGEAAPPPRPLGSLPGEGPFLDLRDAMALHRGMLNANDSALAFATAPIAFRSRDVYALELVAAAHAPSGIERARGERRQVEWIAPPGELLHLWHTQEDFDEALRLGRSPPACSTCATAPRRRRALRPNWLWSVSSRPTRWPRASRSTPTAKGRPGRSLGRRARTRPVRAPGVCCTSTARPAIPRAGS